MSDGHSRFVTAKGRPAGQGALSDLHVRPARKADAGEIAMLINIATRGLFADLWGREQDAATCNSLEAGRRIVLGDGELSWRHADLAEIDDETVGLLLGFSEPEPSGSPAGNSYAELVEVAGGGWHISKLAVHAHWRGRGVAAGLLEAAEARRQETGERRLFLIAPDSFADALRVYARNGFREGGRRPLVLPPSTVSLEAREWVLMIRD